jgi:hypothetical protein
MAVDASIISGLRQPEQANPLQTIGGLMAIKEGQARQALQAQQIRASQAQVADVEQQTQQRDRQNQSLATVTDILKDPTFAAAVGKGDVSELHRRGVDPTIVQQVQKGVLENQTNQAKLDSDTLKLNSEKHTAIGKAIDGILSTYGDQPDLLPEVYRGTLGNLIAEGHLKKGTFPDTIKDVSDLKNLLAVNGYQANINDAALGRKGAEQKINTEASTAEMNRAHGRDFDATANKTNVMTPLEATSKQTENEKNQKINAGMSPLGVTEEQRLTTGETKRHDQATEATTRAEVALKQKQFDATFGSGLDANGKPLSPEEMKSVALQDPTAQAIAHYQLPPPPTQTRGGAPSPILRKVLAINPAYDGTQFQARNKVQQDFSAAGASGKAITSADTALAHLDTLSKAGALLNNSNLPALNQLANAIGVQAGSDPKIVYDGIVRMVAPELSKAVIGATGGEGERQDMAHGLTSNNNDKAREGLIGATAGLLAARVKKQAHAYETSIGAPLDIEKRLSPESLAVMKRYAGQTQGGGSHSVGDTVSVGGKKVKITAIHADGTFDGDEVK